MKIDPTTRHFNDYIKNPDYVRTLVEPTDTPPNRNPVPRLCKSSLIRPLPFTYDGYAETITESSLRDHVFFLDTSFIKKEVPKEFWDAVLQRTVGITDWIDFELSAWKTNPSVNLSFHTFYLQAQQSGNPAFLFLPPPSSQSAIDIAVRHYVGLLEYRKNVFAIVRGQLKSRTGVDPSEVDVQARVQKLVKERGMQIASKGKKDAGKPNFLADEFLVVQAFAYAISTGRDVTILTRDRDLSEQFYKTQYLIDTHYRSMLLADAFAEQPMNFVKVNDPKNGSGMPGFATAEIYRMPAGMDQRVLPDEYKFVNIHVDRIVESGSHLGYTSLRFCAETEMERVLTTKANTNGLSTEALGGLNLHRCVNPAMQAQLGNYMAVAKDQFIEDGERRWAAIDIELALTPCERGAAIETPSATADPPSQDVVRQASEISQFSLPKRVTPTYSPTFVNSSASAISLALRMVDPWSRYLVSSEVIPGMPKSFWSAFANHDCQMLPSKVASAREHGLEASAITEIGQADGRKVFDYYLALIAHRKMFGRVCENQLRRKTGQTPTRRQIRHSVHAFCDPSSWARAKDYLDRPDDVNVFDDEKLAVDAFFKAICNGQETVVLTRRRELVEQFWTMAMIFESHYRAWALAKSNKIFFKRQKCGEAKFRFCFKSDIRLASIASSIAQKALPKHSLEIGVQLWLLDGDSADRLRVYQIGFPVEPAMMQMLQCKERNDFRSAAELDGRNLHFQWAHTEERGHFAQCWLGVDDMVEIGSDDFPSDDRLQISVGAVPAFDLTLMTAQDRGHPFPWAKAEQQKKLRENRKKDRKRRARKKPR